VGGAGFWGGGVGWDGWDVGVLPGMGGLCPGCTMLLAELVGAGGAGQEPCEVWLPSGPGPL